MNTRKKVIVFGGDGMLAYDFSRYTRDIFEVILIKKSQCDIRNFENILQILAIYSPDVVLNAAAITRVDDAEDVLYRENFEVNALWSFFLAKAVAAFGLPLFYISTDYVFDGNNPNWYAPTDIPNPINAYGMAKYLGEKLTMEAHGDVTIIRTSGLFGGKKFDSNQKYPSPKQGIYKNFVNTMLFLAENNNEIRVVDDQFTVPTSTRIVIDFLIEIIQNPENYTETYYHITGQLKPQSWADFAEKIMKKYQKNAKIIRIASSELNAKANRPKYAILRKK